MNHEERQEQQVEAADVLEAVKAASIAGVINTVAQSAQKAEGTRGEYFALRQAVRAEKDTQRKAVLQRSLDDLVRRTACSTTPTALAELYGQFLFILMVLQDRLGPLLEQGGLGQEDDEDEEDDQQGSSPADLAAQIESIQTQRSDLRLLLDLSKIAAVVEPEKAADLEAVERRLLVTLAQMRDVAQHLRDELQSMTEDDLENNLENNEEGGSNDAEGDPEGNPANVPGGDPEDDPGSTPDEALQNITSSVSER